MLRFGSGAKHFQADERAELENSCTYTASSAVDQNAIALPQFCDAMDQLIRGSVIQNEADGFGRIEPGWNSHRFRFRQNDETRISSCHGQRSNQIAGLPLRDRGTAGVND